MLIFWNLCCTTYKSYSWSQDLFGADQRFHDKQVWNNSTTTMNESCYFSRKCMKNEMKIVNLKIVLLGDARCSSSLMRSKFLEIASQPFEYNSRRIPFFTLSPSGNPSIFIPETTRLIVYHNEKKAFESGNQENRSRNHKVSFLFECIIISIIILW